MIRYWDDSRDDILDAIVDRATDKPKGLVNKNGNTSKLQFLLSQIPDCDEIYTHLRFKAFIMDIIENLKLQKDSGNLAKNVFAALQSLQADQPYMEKISKRFDRNSEFDINQYIFTRCQISGDTLDEKSENVVLQSLEKLDDSDLPKTIRTLKE